MVQADRLPVQAIIGNNFLARNRAVIDMGRGTLTMGNTIIEMIPRHAKILDCSSAFLTEEIQIPPRSKILGLARARIKEEDEGGVYLEPLYGAHPKVLFGRSVSNRGCGELWVPILNPSSELVTLAAGICVGKAHVIPPTNKGGPRAIEEGYYVSILQDNQAGQGDRLQTEGSKAPSDYFDLGHVIQGKQQLIKLINSFPEVVSTSEYDLGEARLPPMEIDTGDASPISIPPRRMGPLQRQKIKKTCRENDRSRDLKILNFSMVVTPGASSKTRWGRETMYRFTRPQCCN